MASMIRRSPWPALTHISWLLKSMKRRPSAVWKYTPWAPTTGSGFRPACAAQSYSVSRKQRSVISSALRALTASVTTPEIVPPADSIGLKIASVPSSRNLSTAAAWFVWVLTFTVMLLTVLSVQAVGDRPPPSAYGPGHGFPAVGSRLVGARVFFTTRRPPIPRPLPRRVRRLRMAYRLTWVIPDNSLWYAAP